MAKFLYWLVSPGLYCQLGHSYRTARVISSPSRMITTCCCKQPSLFQVQPRKTTFIASSVDKVIIKHHVISTASQTEYLSFPSADANCVSSSDLCPTEFLNKVDEQALLMSSPKLIAQCLHQIRKQHFRHLQTVLPWLLSHHHDAYNQLQELDKLQNVSETIRHHPKFTILCQRLRQLFRDCNDQELTCSLLSLVYLGVSPEDPLSHSLLFEVRNRIPSMDMQTLTTVSWLCNSFPERDFITRHACIQKLAAACKQDGLLTTDDIYNLCIQEMNHKDLLSSETTLRLCTLILSQGEDVAFFREPQHLAIAASFFARTKIMYLLEKHDLLKAFKSWTQHFKGTCMHLMDKLTDYHVSHICRFLKFSQQYSVEIRKQFEKHSLKLLRNDPSLGKVANLSCSLSRSTSKDVLRHFKERLVSGLNNVDGGVVCLLAQNILNTKANVFDKESLMRIEKVLVEECSWFLQDYNQFKELIALLGVRQFIDKESGRQFFDILLENIIESNPTKQNINALASCYLLSKAEFPESSSAVFETVESSVLHSDDFCAIDMFQFINSVPRDCQNSLRTVENHVHTRLLHLVRNSHDLFHLCYVTKSMLHVDESFKFRDRTLTEAIMTRLEQFIANRSITIAPSAFLSVIDILRLMKYYAPNTLDLLVNHYCSDKNLQVEKVTVRLLCVLSIFSHRSETVGNFIPSVIKLVNSKLECHQYKDVLLLLNYLMRLQVYLEDEIRQLFSFEFMMELNPRSGYVEEPARIVLVELTRRCLLEHPELDIPWFHDEFCRTHLVTGEPSSYQMFRDGVSAALGHVLGGKNYFLRWTYSPYFYSIDFECILDESFKPVNLKHLPPGNVDESWQRVAIVLHTEASYWLYSDQLRGSVRDRKNHLEIMGYKVVPISYKEWFSELLTNEQRVNYLRDHILS